MALKRLCPKCQRVIEPSQRFCDSCQARYDADRKRAQSNYDKSVRRKGDNKTFDDFYKSDMWLRLREYIIRYYNGIDVYEWYTTGKIVEAQTVHHIIELKEDFSKAIKLNNLIPMTLKNHSKIHFLYKRNKVAYQKLLTDMLTKFKQDFKDDQANTQGG